MKSHAGNGKDLALAYGRYERLFYPLLYIIGGNKLLGGQGTQEMNLLNYENGFASIPTLAQRAPNESAK